MKRKTLEQAAVHGLVLLSKSSFLAIFSTIVRKVANKGQPWGNISHTLRAKTAGAA